MDQARIRACPGFGSGAFHIRTAVRASGGCRAVLPGAPVAQERVRGHGDLVVLAPLPEPAVEPLHLGIVHACRHRRHGEHIPRSPPSTACVAPALERPAVAGEGGHADQGGGLAVADCARFTHPGAAVTGPTRRSNSLTPASLPARTFGSGPSGTGSPTSSKVSFSSLRLSTSASRSTVAAMSGNAAPRAARMRASTLAVFASVPLGPGTGGGSPRRPGSPCRARAVASAPWLP